MKMKNTFLTLALGAGSALAFTACDAPSTDFDRDEPGAFDEQIEVERDETIVAPGEQDRYGTDDGFDLNADDPREDGLGDPQDDGLIDGEQELDIGEGNQR